MFSIRLLPVKMYLHGFWLNNRTHPPWVPHPSTAGIPEPIMLTAPAASVITVTWAEDSRGSTMTGMDTPAVSSPMHSIRDVSGIGSDEHGPDLASDTPGSAVATQRLRNVRQSATSTPRRDPPRAPPYTTSPKSHSGSAWAAPSNRPACTRPPQIAMATRTVLPSCARRPPSPTRAQGQRVGRWCG